jgi:hypothetical protein
MNECDERESHTSSKLHMIFISYLYLIIMLDKLFLRPSLHFTQLHFTTLSFGLAPFKFPTAPFHLKSLHFTSLHCTALLDDFRHTSIPFISPRL